MRAPLLDTELGRTDLFPLVTALASWLKSDWSMKKASGIEVSRLLRRNGRPIYPRGATKDKLWTPIGIVFIVLALVLNPWVIATVAIPKDVIEYATPKTAIWPLEILLILMGFMIIRS